MTAGAATCSFAAPRAQRLSTALRALLVGLSQGVILGLADAVRGEGFAAACALVTPDVLGLVPPPGVSA
ncbi:hypothetical protein [Microtetraspora malaysiensis]|uniref:hypothetical protein n=1 Tax=Microtetraspora malaysiensis TaxID=161358 RepID=UPI003D8DA408